jgi:DNA/RNA endonuclease G (NUC1)
MKNYSLLFLLVLTIVSCKKETLTPLPDPASTSAVFSFLDGSGNCYTPVVQGTYNVGIALNSSNTVLIQVFVTKTGTFSILNPTNNGYRFTASGTLTVTGLQTIAMQGSGTPVAAAVDQHRLDGSATCSFTIMVLSPPPPVTNDNDHMYFGNPSNAEFLVDSVNNYLMRKDYYALSYSRDRGTPNWVSWHLFSNDIGSTPRQDDFREDNTLPAGWYRVQDVSYTSSGFDRGHNTPSADRTSTVAANSATFLMTNMIPQAQYNNQIVWAGMEDSLRRLVSQGNELYVIMGSYGMGGTGNGGYKTTIDGGRVTVPANIWKIAIVIPNGNGDSARVTTSTRVIAVNVPNNNSLFSSWKNYRTSVDAIEAATGYDLISRLPALLQATLEASIDNL